jgi:peptidoglycan-associated lipoprotein
VASFGETRPLVDTQDRERRNRRTVTEVTGFVKNHPTLLDGKYASVIYREYVRSATEVPTVSGGISAIESAGGG